MVLFLVNKKLLYYLLENLYNYSKSTIDYRLIRKKEGFYREKLVNGSTKSYFDFFLCVEIGKFI
jgi:hypothetical protein